MSVLLHVQHISLGEQSLSLLSRFDGLLWSTPLGATPKDYISQGTVNAMGISSRGDLIIAGEFMLRNSMVNLARWDGSHFHQLQVRSIMYIACARTHTQTSVHT